MLLARETELQLAEFCAATWWDPLAFVQHAFPWGKAGTFLADHDGPDEFQTEVLIKIRDGLKAIHDGVAASNTVRIAVSSGHGIGKTALMAMIELWWQSTRPHSKSVTTAGTKNQLTLKTWRELEKWRQVCVTGHWFQWTATSLKHVQSPVTWAAEATPWSDNNPQAFAGTHEQWVMYKFDEASTISDSIWETSEGAFSTDGPHIWLAFGNPEQPTGRFRECWTKHRHRWETIEVDARKSRFANKQLIAEWIDTYGEDSDFVRVRVKGVPPKTPPGQFIPTELYETALDNWNQVTENGKKTPEFPRGIPLLMGVDVGAGGSGLTTMVFRRGGFVFKNILRSSERDQVKVAGLIADAIRAYKPHIVFLDATGIGWAVYCILVQLQFNNVVPCFAGDRKEVRDPKVYYNQRIEWWARMRDWLRTGALPDDMRLREDLLAPQFHFNLNAIQLLESKEDMKLRGVPSPDTGDALSLTFAQPTPSVAELQQVESIFDQGPVEPDVV